MIASRFGSVVKFDDDTLQKNNLESARVLIKTSYPELPDKAWEVKVDDKVFQIKIKEEVICQHQCYCMRTIENSGSSSDIEKGVNKIQSGRRSPSEEGEKSQNLNLNPGEEREIMANPRNNDEGKARAVKKTKILIAKSAQDQNVDVERVMVGSRNTIMSK